MKVLNFGSLNIDYVYKVDEFVKEGETIGSSQLNTYSGGKGLNQSIALSRAGCSVIHAGSVGEDGEFLTNLLQDNGIDTNFIKVEKGLKTGHAIIQTNKHCDNCIILYQGANYSITKDYVDEVLSNFHEGDYLILQNEISELDYIVDKASNLGMIIVLNPSPMNDEILKLNFDKINYIILNEHEVSALAKNQGDIESNLEYIHNKYNNLKIVLTLGSKGSIYLDNNIYHWQKSYKVNVVDTTAAGDTYTGYFIASMIKTRDIQKSMSIAAKAAALAVTVNGAAPSIPKIEDVINSKLQ